MQFEIKVDGKTVQFEITEKWLKELGAFEQLKSWDCLRINLELGMREEKNVTIRSIILSIL